MGLAFIPLYIRYLGIEAYGLIGVFALLQSWLSLLDLGMTPAISREMARFTAGGHNAQSIRDLLRSIEIISAVIALLTGLGVWAASGWLASHWVKADKIPIAAVADAFTIMGVVVALRFIENIYRSSIVGLQHQVTLNIVMALMASLRGLGAVAILALVSPTLNAFFLWQGCVSILTVAVLATLVYRVLPRSDGFSSFSVNLLKHVWRFAAGTLVVTALGFLLSQSDKVMLSSLLSLREFAVYSLAYTLASAVRLLSQPIDQAVLPRLTQLYQQGNEASLAALYHKSAQYNAVLMGGMGIFLAIFGEKVLTLWTRDLRLSHETYAVLWILVAGMVLNALMNGPYYLQMAAGWTRLLVRVNLMMVLVFVPMIYFLTKRYGMFGAAATWVVLNLVYAITVSRLMHRRLLRGEMRDWYVRDLLMPLLAGVITGMILKALMPVQLAVVPSIAALILALLFILLVSSLAAGTIRAAMISGLRQYL